MQAQKFYANKSNAARAAKAAFGEDFKNIAELVEGEGGYAYVAKAAAPATKRQNDEQFIREMQGAVDGAQHHNTLIVLGETLDANRTKITDGVYEALRTSIYRRADEITAAEEAAAAAEDAAIAADVAAAKEAHAGEEGRYTEAQLQGMSLTHADNCPHCGIGLDNGYTDFEGVVEAQGSAAKAHKFMTHQFACLGCGGEWGPLVKRNASTIDSPCRAVWDIADQFKKAANGERPRRKDVLEACAQAGIAYYTARTQYQLWLTTQKEMEQRAAQQAKKA